MRQDQKKFKNHNEARYAIYVTFQQGIRPGGEMEEGKNYYS